MSNLLTTYWGGQAIGTDGAFIIKLLLIEN